MTGSESYKAKVQKEVKEKPVLLGNIVMTEMRTESYLGGKLISEGLKSSIEATIKDRIL